MSNEVVRIGILGAAAIAHKNVFAISKADNIEVIAVGSRTISKAEKFISETELTGKAKAYGSYEEVLALPDVDAVYLPLPTATHLAWVQQSAEAKKHILLEKPIALSLKETDAIIKTCEKHNVQLMDGTMFVHHPRTASIRPILDDKQQMGQLRSVTSTFTWKAGEEFLANDIRTKKDGDALGCYGDIGWYCIKAALWVYKFEVPISVQAHPSPILNDNGVVMHGGATIVWEGGRRLTFDCGFDACHSMYLQIAGSDGMVEIPDFCIPFVPDQSKYIKKAGATWHDWDIWIEQPTEEHHVPTKKPQESFMWQKFAECVKNARQTGKTDESWPFQASLCNKLTIAVEESAQNGGKKIDLKSWL